MAYAANNDARFDLAMNETDIWSRRAEGGLDIPIFRGDMGAGRSWGRHVSQHELETIAARVVTSWNTHDDLVAALKAQELADIALEDQSDNFEAWQKLEEEARLLRAAALAKVEAR